MHCSVTEVEGLGALFSHWSGGVRCIVQSLEWRVGCIVQSLEWRGWVHCSATEVEG